MDKIILSIENIVSLFVFLNTLVILCHANLCYRNDNIELLFNLLFINGLSIPAIWLFNSFFLFTQIAFLLFYFIFNFSLIYYIYEGLIDINFYLFNVLIYVLTLSMLIVLESLFKLFI